MRKVKTHLQRQFHAEKTVADTAYQAGDATKLKQLCQRILVSDPCNEYATCNLGHILATEGKIQEAIQITERGLEKSPDSGQLNLNLASLYASMNRFSEASKHIEISLQKNQRDANAWVCKSYISKNLCNQEDVFLSCNKALELEPNNITALNNLATYYLENGRPREAVLRYRDIIEKTPNNIDMARTNLLFAMQYDEESTLDEIVYESKKYANLIEKAATVTVNHKNKPLPWRKLRIGFLSADIKSHPVAYILEPLLARLDRTQYSVYAYHTISNGDALTERLVKYFDSFKSIAFKTIDEQCKTIQADEIDILIDLSGHTAGNAMRVLAEKPAPVQVTWLGYPGTTGLSNIDIRITDEIIDENATDEEYSEKLYILPAPFCVYRPCAKNPIQRYWPEYQVKPTPALTNGYITFGTCNNLSKINSRTLNAWADILRLVPNSKILFEAWGMDDSESKNALIAKCNSHGIATECLILEPRTANNQYLTYHKIDISLDTFPLTGGNSTFDALWMGVPVITLAGRSYRERISTSILTALNQVDWIANDINSYTEKAFNLANDIVTLNQIRQGLRIKLEKSLAMDEVRFSIYFDNALRQAWIHWCEKQNVTIENSPEIPKHKTQVFIGSGQTKDLAEMLTQLQVTISAKEWNKVYYQANLILESVPQQAEALAAFAEADFANGYSMAISYMSHALDNAPNNPNYYIRLTEMLIANGDNISAQKILKLLELRISQSIIKQ
ncbi:tetratricopeptide repeat protein [Chitinibacter bivalviorum]|uniref:protein O-GlcNAc transferase n=1 Tax=Chitinibacter bivalviorum TaxID=2739434 RepID=A0A7H9BGK8_9NEIS|nr:tetratricopeptide repeat protein [Chitinibacter bivalviorum]QLG87396.1 tetratricopeptide repeat protein [Chitinibacter bivalviorum]